MGIDASRVKMAIKNQVTSKFKHFLEVLSQKLHLFKSYFSWSPVEMLLKVQNTL